MTSQLQVTLQLLQSTILHSPDCIYFLKYWPLLKNLDCNVCIKVFFSCFSFSVQTYYLPRVLRKVLFKMLRLVKLWMLVQAEKSFESLFNIFFLLERMLTQSISKLSLPQNLFVLLHQHFSLQSLIQFYFSPYLSLPVCNLLFSESREIFHVFMIYLSYH